MLIQQRHDRNNPRPLLKVSDYSKESNLSLLQAQGGGTNSVSR